MKKIINNLILLSAIGGAIMVFGCTKDKVDGPLRARVVDSITNKPIEGVYIAYYVNYHWNFRQIFPGLSPMRLLYLKTNKDGIFIVPRQVIGRTKHCHRGLTSLEFFKPGYLYYDVTLHEWEKATKVGERPPRETWNNGKEPHTVTLERIGENYDPCQQWDNLVYSFDELARIHIKQKGDGSDVAEEILREMEKFTVKMQDGHCYLVRQFFKVVNKGRLRGNVTMLDEHPELVNARDEIGATPLHHVVGDDDSLGDVKLLVERGAEINARDHTGRTPLAEAMETSWRSEKIVEFLKAHGAVK